MTNKEKLKKFKRLKKEILEIAKDSHVRRLLDPILMWIEEDLKAGLV